MTTERMTTTVQVGTVGTVVIDATALLSFVHRMRTMDLVGFNPIRVGTRVLPSYYLRHGCGFMTRDSSMVVYSAVEYDVDVVALLCSCVV